MQEHIFRFLFDYLVPGTCLLFLVLSADVKPEINFYTRFYTDISSFEASKS